MLCGFISSHFSCKVRLHFGPDWVGKRIEIDWDDETFYDADVLSMNRDGTHKIMFREDESVFDVRLSEHAIRLPYGDSEAASGTGSRRAAQRTDLVKEHYGRNWIGRRIEIYWPHDKLWYAAVVKGYDNSSGVHMVTYDIDGANEGVRLNKEKFRPKYEKEAVGRAIRIFWPEYDEWFGAHVMRWNRDGSHTIRYIDDSSEESVILGQEIVRIVYGEEMQGNKLEIYVPSLDSWAAYTVVGYNARDDTHSLEAHNGTIIERELASLTFHEVVV